ncbi:MAG: hypothetical protein FWD61_17400 [Phycisphaerales bacterium]|nr:hypothetical protein [Phycisphaerales bacterium]
MAWTKAKEEGGTQIMIDREGDDRVPAEDRRSELRVVEIGRRQARRYEEGRQKRGRMMHLASLLPIGPRSLMTAYLQTQMTVVELAVLHKTTPRIMRRRLDRLCEMLEDELFVAAAERADDLPGELAKVARAYWLEGRPLRELARSRGESLHHIRQVVTMARTLLAAGGLTRIAKHDTDQENTWAVEDDE